MALPPITDYASLVANLSDYIARDDLEGYYATFIQLAEKRLNSGLKALGMQGVSALTTNAAGQALLPGDYIEWLSLGWVDAGGKQRHLRYVEPNSPEFTFRHRPNGSPQFYTISGGLVRLAPGRSLTLELVHYKRIPPLTVDAPTNWLITTAPQLYLYATLGEAYVFQKDEARAAEWLKMAEERLGQFVQESSSGKVGRRAERAAEDQAEAIAAKALN
ncbi:hypothetical protein [Methylobacterium sp.]|uniref:phage adaptor protein n=1 Tax=Methylobacterium sp. TaxID=409 RepID=UPI0025CDED29|nr:hypothetical protein [Methylobacterium sp.]MBY0260159.1 hypothetical protein [Methylobacterium sp.]